MMPWYLLFCLLNLKTILLSLKLYIFLFSYLLCAYVSIFFTHLNSLFIRFITLDQKLSIESNISNNEHVMNRQICYIDMQY